MKRVVKSKIAKIAVIVVLLFNVTSFISKPVSAEEKELIGFIIQADLIVGNTMVTKIDVNNQGKPVIRFQYDQAEIHGMTLVKEFNTPKGPVSTIIKASGPIMAQNLVVDTTAIDFKGACVSLGKSYPEIGMKNVTLVSEYMTSSYMDMKSLALSTISGHSAIEKPQPATVLKDLSKKGEKAMNDEIENISQKQLPLSCEPTEEEDVASKYPIDEVEEVLDPIDGVIPDEITDPLEDKILDPILEIPGEVIDPILDIPDKVLDPVLEIPGEIIDPVREIPPKVVDSIIDVPIEPLDPVVDPLLEEALVLIDDTLLTLNDVVDILGQTKDSTLKEKIVDNITSLEKFKESSSSITKEQLERIKEINKQANTLKTMTNSIISKTIIPIKLITLSLLNVLVEPLDILSNQIHKL